MIKVLGRSYYLTLLQMKHSADDLKQRREDESLFNLIALVVRRTLQARQYNAALQLQKGSNS